MMAGGAMRSGHSFWTMCVCGLRTIASMDCGWMRSMPSTTSAPGLFFRISMRRRIRRDGPSAGRSTSSLKAISMTRDAYALTEHVRGGRGDYVHFEAYVHTDKFSLKVLKGSIDKLGEAYREMLKGLL